MAEAYSYATRALAEQLYVFRGRTYDEISREISVSVSQLMRWSKAGEWKQKRDQYLQSKSQNLTRLIGVRDRIIEHLEGEIQPGTVTQLLAGLRQADAMIDQKLTPGGGDIDRPALFLEDLRFISETLGEVDPEGLKILSRNFDIIIDRFKERHAQAA
jgi:hypothetical protein